MLIKYGPSITDLDSDRSAYIRRAVIYEVNKEEYRDKTIVEVQVDIIDRALKVKILVAKPEDECFLSGSKDFMESDPSLISTSCSPMKPSPRRSVLSRIFTLITTAVRFVFRSKG